MVCDTCGHLTMVLIQAGHDDIRGQDYEVYQCPCCQHIHVVYK